MEPQLLQGSKTKLSVRHALGSTILEQSVHCPGLKCKECFDCREPGHFKGAPCCKKPKKSKPTEDKEVTK